VHYLEITIVGDPRVCGNPGLGKGNHHAGVARVDGRPAVKERFAAHWPVLSCIHLAQE
jgi:hypothetical protein